jgi:sulfide:quinone oxidoreductase
MATVVVLGAGIAGHTAALVLRRMLPRQHEVVVVCPRSDYNWVPSNIWVGVGRMAADAVLVPLRPVYDRMGISFVQARATELYPEGGPERPRPFVRAERTDVVETVEVEFDYLINATGPQLRFDRTPGLGPEGHSHSVCTEAHAGVAAQGLAECIARMRAGERQTLVIGAGHGQCTCEGAAFEYTFNVEHELRRAGVRERADVVYLTNEAQLGDFGIDGMVFKRGGYLTPSDVFAGSLFAERGVRFVLGAHVERVEAGGLTAELLDGNRIEQAFDFAMLLPPFSGVGLRAFDRHGAEVTDAVFAASGFMKVDADYTPKAYDEWVPEDWPKVYRSPVYDRLYAVGIAFAPPHALSRPRTSPNGTVIAPAPPRTGMPSATMARAVAENIADAITGRAGPPREASLATMAAACVASAGTGLLSGSAVAMTMYPIVPDYRRYPGTGRDPALTSGELGTAGHWIKVLLHHAFLYKARARPGWWLIPE